MPTAFLRIAISVPVYLCLALAPADAAPPGTAPVQAVPIDGSTVFQAHRVGDTAIAGAERLLYASTLGTYAVALGANNLVADEISTTAAPGCPLRRIQFPVFGKVSPGEIGGPFSVEFALYTTCPGSITPTLRPAFLIPGSLVHLDFPDDAPRMISFALPGDGLPIPSTVWFAVKFNRANAGMVMGAPALTGFSCDTIDFPGFACNAWLGGFPDHPYANFNLELFGDADCGSSFVGYMASRPSGPVYNPGASITLTDDIQLGVPSCRMTGYEVAVRGVGNYTFDLRTACDAVPIDGTQRTYNVPFGTDPRIARFSFDPPIQIPSTLRFAAVTDNHSSGVVLTGQQACVGSTQDGFQVPSELGGCTDVDSPIPGFHGTINLTIFCEGEAPTGACCDMYFLDSAGEAVCREVPQMNCAFPPRFSTTVRPFWESGDTCDPDPFTPDCGLSCCCKPDGTKANMTQNQCNAVEPLSEPREWQRGLPCGVSGQQCPVTPCIDRVGCCSEARDCPHTCPDSCRQYGTGCPPTGCDECPPIGCGDPYCCTAVCTQRDDFCCLVEWDEACADIAVQICHSGCGEGPDECAPSGRREGASFLTLPDSEQTSTFTATESHTDPGFGCYKGDPGHRAFDTHWYKFIAPPAISPATRSIVSLQTCMSNGPANDSLLQVFAVGDSTNEITQCNSMIPIACSDDFAGPGCTRVSTLSRLCLRDLVPGKLYYVLVGGKTPATNSSAALRVDIAQVSSCIAQLPDDTNDYCPRAIAITDGVTPFNLARTNPPYTLDMPESCALGMSADMWFKYTATCTGTLNVHTCGGSAQTSPDTNLAIYSTCPSTSQSAPLACSQDTGGDCGLASSIILDAVQGQEFTIRLGDNAQNLPSGNLTISCTPADCPAGAMEFVADGILGLPAEVIDPRRPHDPANPEALLTTQTVQVTTTRDAQPSCFSLCETASAGSPNFIAAVTPGPIEGLRQRYTVTLARPITPGAKTAITYTPDAAAASHVHLYSHPGNVNADATVNEADITALRNALGLPSFPPLALWTFDLDRSSAITPADLLEAVDLQNGAGAYIPWSGTPSPATNAQCP